MNLRSVLPVPLALCACMSASMTLAQSPAPTPGGKPRPAAKMRAASPAPAAPAAEPEIQMPLLATASLIHVGDIPCELGQKVRIEADLQKPGYFNVHARERRFRMAPVVTSTGALRLEDPHGGGVWLQLANKSMLMDQKQGKRLADECMTPAQAAVAEGLKTQPAPSLLDAPKTVAATEPRPALPQPVTAPVASGEPLR
jgi:hypothetical protein